METNPTKTAILLNDTTSWYHWGCTATSLGLKAIISEEYDLIDSLPINATYELKAPPTSPSQFDDEHFFRRQSAENDSVYSRIGSADCVFVNGEGTIHGTGRACINLLYMAYTAKRFLRKKVYIVNHSVYPEYGPALRQQGIKEFYSSVYSAFDYVAIREPESKSLMDSLGVRSTQSFDCLPYYVTQALPQRKTRSNTLVVAGSVAFQATGLADLAKFMGEMRAKGYGLVVLTGARQFPAADDRKFVEALRAVLDGSWRHVDAASLEEWLETIGGASLLVSGRFHHSLAAFALKTPFVMMTSNTRKIVGLHKMLGLPEPLDYRIPRLSEALRASAEYALSEEFSREVFRKNRVDSTIDLARRNVPRRAEIV